MLVVCALRAGPAGIQRFYSFLIDLKGWTAKKPVGNAPENGRQHHDDPREYRRDDARFERPGGHRPGRSGRAAAAKASVDIAEGDAHMHTGAIEGLPVARTYTVHDHVGTVLVALGSSAMSVSRSACLGEDEALALAQQFDWQALQAELLK